MVLLYPNGRPVERSITRPTIERLKATTLSVIPDAMYPWDPVVVKWIQREFDPDFVPVFVKRIWRTSTGERIEYHHAAAASSSAENLGERIHAPLFRSLMPTWGRLYDRRPTRIHFHFYHRDLKSGNRKKGIGGYVPFNWGIYDMLVSARSQMTAQQQREFVERHSPEHATEKLKEAATERAANEEKNDDNWLGREVAKFDVTDWERVRAKGLAYQPNPATRPSVYVRRPA